VPIGAAAAVVVVAVVATTADVAALSEVVAHPEVVEGQSVAQLRTEIDDKNFWKGLTSLHDVII
jgi:hypothetical protein